jgi:hypothetical protein
VRIEDQARETSLLLWQVLRREEVQEMTPTEYCIEHRHIYETRLAILEAPPTPTTEQHNLAVAEADAHIASLKAHEKQDSIRCLLDFRDSIA